MLAKRYRPMFLAFLFALTFIGLLPSQVWAEGKNYRDQDLEGKIFMGQMLDGADFSGASLHLARFPKASLRGAIFDGADLRLADFKDADLTGADLRKSVMPFSSEHTNFSNANLEGLDFTGAGRWLNNNFRGANLRNTTGYPESCTNCSFRNADLRGANFSGMEEPGQDGMFIGALYDETTHWPAWLDVEKSGARRPQ